MGLFDKPKTPKPTAQELSLERRQRRELDKLTDEENRRIKLAKRGAGGRRALLSGNFISGQGNARPGGASSRGGVMSGAGRGGFLKDGGDFARSRLGKG